MYISEQYITEISKETKEKLKKAGKIAAGAVIVGAAAYGAHKGMERSKKKSYEAGREKAKKEGEKKVNEIKKKTTETENKLKTSEDAWLAANPGKTRERTPALTLVFSVSFNLKVPFSVPLK